MISPEYPGRRPDRIAAYRNSAKSVSIFRAKEAARLSSASWSIYDAPLRPGFFKIGDYRSFERTFKGTLPEGQNLKSYIEKVASNTEGATGVELGGPGSNLFHGFNEGVFTSTRGITLHDGRSKTIRSSDERRGHDVIEGDLLDPKTDEDILTWMNGRPLDLVIQRMAGGLNALPKDPYLYAQYLERWYERVSENGVMFVQLPLFMEPLAKPWIERAEALGKGRLELAYSNPGTEEDLDRGLRIKKLPGAPETLPLLSPRELKEAYRKAA